MQVYVYLVMSLPLCGEIQKPLTGDQRSLSAICRALAASPWAWVACSGQGASPCHLSVLADLAVDEAFLASYLSSLSSG